MTGKQGESRRMRIGAEAFGSGGVHFRVWAPLPGRVELVVEDGPGAPTSLQLEPEGEGYYAGFSPEAGPGTRYRFRLDGQEGLCPDPASRFQPDGPHGPSQVVDPSTFDWTDQEWRGVDPTRAILYELHVGTFTAEGSWAAAGDQLPMLADLGITVIELMPVAEFAGRFGWGYDGVNLFAPTRLYGSPDDFRAFVDRAHAAGIGVILDVVYNHLGPDGNYLPHFSDSYFTDCYQTEWGEPLNFHGPGSESVREYFIENAAYWIREFHLDGLRLDATQNIYDTHLGGEHIVARVAGAAREAGEGRTIFVVAENESQNSMLLRSPESGGQGLDALWNDDFHHAASVALTGRKEAYYSDYLGTPQEFVSAAKWGFLFQGQRYDWQKKRRGSPSLDIPNHAFIDFIQNHDQVANSGRGARMHRLASPGRLRALTTLTILGPGTPMLFMGQEFAASTPFLYFADHASDLARAVNRGRRDFLRQFPSLAVPELQAGLADPADPATFARCKLDFAERERNAEVYTMHRDLLHLRRTDPVLGTRRKSEVDGAVLSDAAFLIRFFGEAGDDRLLIVNLGRDLRFSPAPEPLLAPPTGKRWTVLWSSERPEYGGTGAPEPESEDGQWQLAGEAAILLAAAR